MLFQIITFALFLLITTGTAHAYIDPGTGSMIIQVLSGFILAGAVTFKLWFKNVKEFLAKRQKVENKADEPSNSQ